jgi:hypothetical protein
MNYLPIKFGVLHGMRCGDVVPPNGSCSSFRRCLLKKVPSLRDSRPLPPRCPYSCSSPAPRLRSSLFACTVALNCSNRPVFRINLIAAVAPCLVPRTSFRSLTISPNSSSLSLSHCGQDRRTCRTLIAACPHAQRLFQTPGTLLSYKNSLKPILPVRSWVSSALCAFALPACNVRFFPSGSSAILRRCCPLVPRFHLSFHFLSSSSPIAFCASCI